MKTLVRNFHEGTEQNHDKTVKLVGLQVLPNTKRSGTSSVHYSCRPVATNSLFNIKMATTTQNTSSVSEPNPQDKTLMTILNNML